jgi:hypothetical protein
VARGEQNYKIGRMAMIVLANTIGNSLLRLLVEMRPNKHENCGVFSTLVSVDSS